MRHPSSYYVTQYHTDLNTGTATAEFNDGTHVMQMIPVPENWQVVNFFQLSMYRLGDMQAYREEMMEHRDYLNTLDWSVEDG